MGGLQKGLGKIYQPVRKVIDPLNIMDPFNILPGATLGGGRKPFSFDKNFGGPLAKMFSGGGGSSSYSMPRSSMDTSGMFSAQNQMLASMKAQSASDLARRQASNEALRSSSPLFPTIPTQTATQTTTSVATSTPATTTPFIAQSKISDTTAGADLPVEFVYKPATSQQQYVASNQFNLPDMSNIKFGGT
jgi:hypothetical protein